MKMTGNNLKSKSLCREMTFYEIKPGILHSSWLRSELVIDCKDGWSTVNGLGVALIKHSAPMRNTRVVRMFLMMILFSSLGFATAVAVAVCDKSKGDYYD